MRQNTLQTARARQLRQDQTEAEKRLWFALRARQFRGLKFRRQVPIGPYIVDFLCAERTLVVEADGGQHADALTDQRRDQWLEGQGFRVLRFSNSDILTNLPGVLARLSEEIER
ncbi:MAG: endonuclease domain-containing protein [Ruegeria sp.]|uniref:endonuclease domain-containing protein n=1 Tax=Ruegeria sp. TaxID=1879320 RepID=UPI00349EE8DF